MDIPREMVTGLWLIFISLACMALLWTIALLRVRKRLGFALSALGWLCIVGILAMMLAVIAIIP
ncbi:MAG: hypothetical protein O7A08_14095 [SAR324 cluster bacterium]|nr:hypothetical protein [SAR324 cluster bacterium]